MSPIENPLTKGIKIVGIGKKGTGDLTEEQIRETVAFIKKGDFIPEQYGAFIGGLFQKKISPAEEQFQVLWQGHTFSEKGKILSILIENSVPKNISSYCIRISEGLFLSEKEAFQMGEYLFDKQSDMFIRGFVAATLRVRYESREEFNGLLKSIVNNNLEIEIKKKGITIQLSEPFDGFKKIHVITPLIAREFISQGYDVVSLGGRCPGPKFGITLQ